MKEKITRCFSKRFVILQIDNRGKERMFFRKKHLNSVDTPHLKGTAACSTKRSIIPEVVRISLAQNIGAPCEPLVKRGDYVKVGQKIGDTVSYVSAPVHASVSGAVREIETVRSASGGKEKRVVIDSDGKQLLFDGITKPEITDRESFIKAIRESGLVGLGGAAFPTHVKLSPKNLDEVDTLIINGAECEPFLTSDHREMLEDADFMIDGALAIMKYLEIKQGIIAIESNKPDAIVSINDLLAKRRVDNIKTVSLVPRYPKGAERVLIYEVTGRVMKGGMLPADVGCIVSNVSSVGFIGHYLRNGFPLVNRRITVDGDAVAHPGNIFIPVGASVADAVESCGGYIAEPAKIVMGGPMMGRAVYSDSFCITKNCNGVLVFSRAYAEPPEVTNCINCGRCHTACPFDLLPTGFADAYEHHDVERLKQLRVMECMECGSCSYVCPAHRPLQLMNKMSKMMIWEAGK